MSLCKAACAVVLIALHGTAQHEGGERVVTTELAGVPAILRIPARATKPPIVLWHGFGAPASEQELMLALPLDDVPAVKVYLGLPLFGKRAPPGGANELARRQQEDLGLQVFEPVVVGAAQELPNVTRELARRGYLKSGDKIGVFGFSAGGASALLSLAEHDVRIGATILLNPSTGLTASVRAFEQATHQSYEWTPRSRALAARTDAQQRAADIAKATPLPALLILEGSQDDLIAHQSLSSLETALTPFYTAAHDRERLQHRVLEGLPHNITGSHSDDELGREVSAWFNRYLQGPRSAAR
jgi:pimeloyl-ACP methyl ester carboxylesterase